MCFANFDVSQDFFALKKPSTTDGFEPVNLGSSSEYDNHGTTRRHAQYYAELPTSK